MDREDYEEIKQEIMHRQSNGTQWMKRKVLNCMRT